MSSICNLDTDGLNVKDNLLLQVYNHFVESSDYNGALGKTCV